MPQNNKTLIDNAAKVCGSLSALAKKIDLQRSVLTEIRQGKRLLTPESAALIAKIAGASVNSAVHESMLKRVAGTAKEGPLKEALASESKPTQKTNEGFYVRNGVRYQDRRERPTA